MQESFFDTNYGVVTQTWKFVSQIILWLVLLRLRLCIQAAAALDVELFIQSRGRGTPAALDVKNDSRMIKSLGPSDDGDGDYDPIRSHRRLDSPPQRSA